tara:strand:- start:17486 stop:17893 length:408 start_codon:yes stop_codon:yes gene_type:complete
MKHQSKKGQISIEIMYSIGVLMVIFILLSSVTFDRKIDVERARDTVDKRSDCIMISNALGRVASLGEGYSSEFTTTFNFDVFTTGLIIVGDVSTSSPEEIEVICTFNGNLYQDYIDQTGLNWKVNNVGGVLSISQ